MVNQNQIISIALAECWVLLLQVSVAKALLELVIQVVFELINVLNSFFILLLWHFTSFIHYDL